MSSENNRIIITSVRSVPAMHGFSWIIQALALFRKQPFMWIIVSMVQVAITMFMSVFPLISAFAFIIYVILAGSFALMAQKTQQGQSIAVPDLLLGFKTFFSPLIGASFGVFIILIPFYAMLFSDGTLMSLTPEEIKTLNNVYLQGDQQAFINLVQQHKEQFVMIGFLMVLMTWLTTIFTWFVAPLTTLGRLTPGSAILKSLWAILMNPLPLIVCSLVIAVLAVLSIFPLMGLGFFLLMPVSNILGYCIWKDVFM